MKAVWTPDSGWTDDGPEVRVVLDDGGRFVAVPVTAPAEQVSSIDAMRDGAGKLPAFTSVGGYPLAYVTRAGLTVCAECANGDDDDVAVAGDVYWEGDPMECDGCDNMIASAYGPTDDTDDDRCPCGRNHTSGEHGYGPE